MTKLAAAPPSIECCVQCGEPKNNPNLQAGDEVANGWPLCENPACVAFGQPTASAWYRPTTLSGTDGAPASNRWFAPMPSFAHYWRLQKLYFVAGASIIPVAGVGAVLIERYGFHDAIMVGTLIVGLVVSQLAWNWADKRIAKVPE